MQIQHILHREANTQPVVQHEVTKITSLNICVRKKCVCTQVRIHSKGRNYKKGFFTFFSRKPITYFAWKTQHDAAAEDTTLRYLLHEAFKLAEILNCKTEIILQYK